MLNKEAQLNAKISRGEFLKRTGISSAAVLVFSTNHSAEVADKSPSPATEPSQELKHTAVGAAIGAAVGVAGVMLSGNMETEFSYFRISRREAIKRITAGLVSGLVFGGIAGNQVGKNNDNERALKNVPRSL